MSAVTTGAPHASAWNTLFGITRRAFGDVPKMPSAQPQRAQLVGQSLVLDPRDATRRSSGRASSSALELAAADDAEPELRCEPRRLEDRLQPVQRDQLADEERGERRPAVASRAWKSALLRADEADLDAPRAELARRARLRVGVGDDEIGAAKGRAVDCARSARAASEPARKRPRSATSVSASETSGLKTTGRPRAARFAAGRSRWPG